MSQSQLPGQLPRELGVFGATMMGLSSLLGVGIFVSLGIAAGIAGSGLMVAVVLAGVIALSNSFNSAQLGVAHPISGGVYEYGYRYLTPWLGFTGGWAYLMARTAAAATAALGFGTYLTNMLGWDESSMVLLALLTLVGTMGVVLNGMRHTKIVTVVIVGGMLLALTILGFSVIAAGPTWQWQNVAVAESLSWSWFQHTFAASALMFVAFGGYARIATLGEEVSEPQRNIPRAMGWTLAISTLCYSAIALLLLAYLGVEGIAQATEQHQDPLALMIHSLNLPGAKRVLTLGAMTAMLGVLLSSVLGLSRMILAMARRGDFPRFAAQLNGKSKTPHWAVICIGGAITLLILTGDIQTTWSFGAFASLIRGSITNWAALQLSPSEQRYPRWLSQLSLVSCAFLLLWLEPKVWLIGSGFITLGLLWHLSRQMLPTSQSTLQPVYLQVLNEPEKAFKVIWERYQANRFPKP